MPTYEQEIINRLQTQVGTLVGAMAGKDIQLEILIRERDEANVIITALGGELPVSQISTGGINVSGVAQDTGAQGAGETAGSPHPTRSKESGVSSKRTSGKGGSRKTPDITS